MHPGYAYVGGCNRESAIDRNMSQNNHASLPCLAVTHSYANTQQRVKMRSPKSHLGIPSGRIAVVASPKVSWQPLIAPWAGDQRSSPVAREWMPVNAPGVARTANKVRLYWIDSCSFLCQNAAVSRQLM
jgi:hypothetical protein